MRVPSHRARLGSTAWAVPWGLALALAASALAAAPEEPESGTKDEPLWLEVTKDQTVGQLVESVRDARGNVYQLAPGGPQLRLGVSAAAIQAQSQKYGYRLLRAGKPPRLVLSAPPASVKERVASVMRAERGAARMNAAWEIAKLGDKLYTAYTGEGSVSEAQHEIIAETIAAELGLGVSLAAGKVGAVAGVGVGVGVLGTWAAGQVKEAIVEGLAAWEAAEQATSATQAWKENDVRLANEKLQQIRRALSAGDYERARALNGDLNAFTESRRPLGGPRLAALNGLTFKLQDAIRQAERAKAKALAEAARVSQAEWSQRLGAWHAKVQARLERERAERAEFDARLLVLDAQVPPGANVAAGLMLTGGAPPFQLQGDFPGALPSRVARFQFRAPAEPGVYGLDVTATDAVGRSRHTHAVLVVDGPAKPAAPKLGAPLDERHELGGCQLSVRVEGLIVGERNEFTTGPTQKSIRIYGTLEGDSVRISGSAAAPPSSSAHDDALVAAYLRPQIDVYADAFYRRSGEKKAGVTGTFEKMQSGLTQAEVSFIAQSTHCAVRVDGKFRRPGKKHSRLADLEDGP